MDGPPNIERRTKLPQGGFTLIELVIVVAIAALLIVVALPSMQEMVLNQRVRGTANDLFMDLSYARSEAIKRNTTVQLVRTGATWSEGWTMQVGATVLRVQSGTKGVAAPAAPANVSFGPDGRTTSAANVDIPFSSTNALVGARCVSVTPSGRPQVRIDRNRDGNCANG
jgi:type IV fimbrial biogenesis protein FimT